MSDALKTYTRSLPMAMLPNDNHPGTGCSCQYCLRAFRVYPKLPPVGTSDAKVTFNHREWERILNLIQDSPEFDSADPADKHLLAKLEWHCENTYDIPDNDDRPPPAENE